MTQVQVGEGLVLLNPKAEQEVKEISLAPRLPSINGATIAVINACKDQKLTHGELAARHIGDIFLREGAGEVLTMVKQNPAQDMSEEILDHITSQSQGAVILEGD